MPWLRIWLLLAALVLAPGVRGADEACSQLLPAGFDAPPNQARSGHYVNAVYGYALRIPNGLTGYVAMPGPERGFGIVLSEAPRAYVRVDAAYDAFYDITAPVVHRRDLNALLPRGKILEDRAFPASLHHAPGGRYLTRVQCPDDGGVYVHDDLIIVRDREIYRIDLQTVPSRYDADRHIMEALWHSWRWVPIHPEAPHGPRAGRRRPEGP